MQAKFIPHTHCATLLEKVKPMVMEVIGDAVREANSHRSTLIEPDMQVQFVEWMPKVEGIMYHVILRFVGKMGLGDERMITRDLEDICSYEQRQRIEIEGYHFLLGDGDDSLAVWFENGAYRIWLRGWRDPQMAGIDESAPVSESPEPFKYDPADMFPFARDPRRTTG